MYCQKHFPSLLALASASMVVAAPGSPVCSTAAAHCLADNRRGSQPRQKPRSLAFPYAFTRIAADYSFCRSLSSEQFTADDLKLSSATFDLVTLVTLIEFAIFINVVHFSHLLAPQPTSWTLVANNTAILNFFFLLYL